MKTRFIVILALGFLLFSCSRKQEVFHPVLYSWEVARDSIVMPRSGWIVSCGSPDKAIYRFSSERLAPGVACEDGWLFGAFLLREVPCEGEDLPDYWLNPKYGTVASLEKAVAQAASTLGEPPAKRMYTIALPPGADDDECIEYIDRIRSMADSLDTPHLELLGFTTAEELPQRVYKYAAACHEVILDEKAMVSFDYSVVEDIMDQPGVKSPDGAYTLKDVPARQKALRTALESAESGPVYLDCGTNTLVQLSRSSYESDRKILATIQNFIMEKNEE